MRFPRPLAELAGTLAVLGITVSARAGTLDSRTSLGASSLIETLAYDSAPGTGESRFSWNLSITGSQVKSPSVDGTSDDVVNKSFDFDGGVAAQVASGLQLSVGFLYAATPSEFLRSFGPHLSADYTIYFGARPDPHVPKPDSVDTSFMDGDDDDKTPSFVPNLSFRGSYSRTKFATDSGQRRRLVNSSTIVTATDEILQSGYGLELTLAPWDWSSVRIGYTRYRYNKDVQTFLGHLDQQQAVNAGLTSLSATVSGFARDSSEIGISVEPSELWTVDLSLTTTHAELDESPGHGSRLNVSREFSELWKLGLGVERDVSPTTTQSALIVDVAYEIR